MQGGHSPGEPGKVREFKSGQGKIREKRKSQGKCVLAYDQLPQDLILTQNQSRRKDPLYPPGQGGGPHVCSGASCYVTYEKIFYFYAIQWWMQAAHDPRHLGSGRFWPRFAFTV